jgi:hypothetical protein
MREHAVEHGLSYTFAKRFHGARWWTDRNWYLAIDLNHSDQRGPYYSSSAPFYEAVTFSQAMKSQTPASGRPICAATPMPTATGLLRRPHRYLIDNDQQRGGRGSRTPTSSPTMTDRSTSTLGRPAQRAGVELDPNRSRFEVGL